MSRDSSDLGFHPLAQRLERVDLRIGSDGDDIRLPVVGHLDQHLASSCRI